MIKLIDRYVGKQIVVNALFAISVLSVVLVLGNVFKQIFDLLINRNVPVEYILSFIVYVLPFSLTFTIPWGFLTAVLLVFGRLSAENELVALRTSGISIPRISVPMFALAAICVGVCLWINLDFAPRAQKMMKNAIYKIATSNPIAMFSGDQVIEDFPGKKIYVEKKEGNELLNILVYELNEKNEPVNVIHAKKGVLEADLPNQQILMHISDGRYERRDPQSPNDMTKIQQGITVRETVFPISLQKLYERNQRRLGISQMSLAELMDVRDASLTPRQRTAKRVEINKRFSFSLASFALALIALPLAVTAQRRETSIGFLFSLVLAFTYFFFIIIANALRENPRAHPEFLIWMPNILFILLGGCLFRQLAKK